MTWNDLEVGDKFKNFGVEGTIIEKIKSVTGNYIKTIKIENEDKKILMISIGGDKCL